MQNSVGQEPKNVKKNDFWTDSARIALHAMQRKTSVPSRRKKKVSFEFKWQPQQPWWFLTFMVATGEGASVIKSYRSTCRVF